MFWNGCCTTGRPRSTTAPCSANATTPRSTTASGSNDNPTADGTPSDPTAPKSSCTPNHSGPEQVRAHRVRTGVAGCARGVWTQSAVELWTQSAVARSAVEDRPADVIAFPLVVEDEFANRFGELVALPLALESPSALLLTRRSRRTDRLDRVGGRTEVMRGDVCHDCGLPGGIRGVARRASQVPGRAHRMAACRTSPGHRDLAGGPRAGMLDGLTRSRVVRAIGLEPVENMLGTHRRLECEQVVVLIGESPTAADRHEPRIAVSREDHVRRLSGRVVPGRVVPGRVVSGRLVSGAWSPGWRTRPVCAIPGGPPGRRRRQSAAGSAGSPGRYGVARAADRRRPPARSCPSDEDA